jgi:dUTP pyrophosphatase
MSKNKNFQPPAMRFKKLTENAQLPGYATSEAAGMDIRSNAEMVIGAGLYAMVSTGLSVEIPAGYELQVRPRSGLAAKFGVTVLNAPGTIDSDYRGEIKVLLVNHGKQPFEIKIGDRIAQLVLARALQGKIEEVVELTATQRGEGGFGSTGVS